MTDQVTGTPDVTPDDIALTEEERALLIRKARSNEPGLGGVIDPGLGNMGGAGSTGGIEPNVAKLP